MDTLNKVVIALDTSCEDAIKELNIKPEIVREINYTVNVGLDRWVGGMSRDKDNPYKGCYFELVLNVNWDRLEESDKELIYKITNRFSEKFKEAMT